MPVGIVKDKSGNLFIADIGNFRTRKINSKGIISTFAGTGIPTYSGGGSLAISTSFEPTAIAIDSIGNMFISDETNNRILKINKNGILTTIAGNDTVGFSGDGEPAIAAKLYSPVGIAVDKYGNIYFCDQLNNRVRKIDTHGIITTIAGIGGIGHRNGGFGGDGNVAIKAILNEPSGINIDAKGNLYIADYLNNRIRKIDTNNIITTVAGSLSKIPSPVSVKADNLGNIYMATEFDNRILKIG